MKSEAERKYQYKEIVPVFILFCVTAVLIYRCFFSFVWSDESFYLSLVHRFWTGDRPIIDEWSGVQFYAVALLPIYSLYRMLVGSSDGVYLFFRIIMVLADFALSLYIYQSLRKKGDVWPAFLGALLFLLYTRANIHGASYYSFALFFFTWSLFLIWNELDKSKGQRMLLAGCTMALAVLAIPYLAVFYIAAVCMVWIVPQLCSFRKQTMWMMGGTLCCAVIYCAFLLTRAGTGDIFSNISHIFSDAEHESNNILFSIVFWLARIANRYKYTLPGLAMAFIYVLCRKGRKIKCNFYTDIMYVITNLAIFAINIIVSDDMAGCVNIAVGILAVFLCFLSSSSQNAVLKRAVWLVFFPGLIFSMLFHYASNTGLDAITVGFAVCVTVSPLMIGEGIKGLLLGSGTTEKLVRGAAFVLLAVAAFQSGWLRLSGVYRDGAMSELNVQLSLGPAKYLYTTEEHAVQYMDLLKTVERTCDVGENERIVFVEMAPWAYLCVKAPCGAPSPCRFWEGLSEDNLKKYYEESPERFPAYVCDVAPEYGSFRSVYIQRNERGERPNGTDAGNWLIEAVQSLGYEEEKTSCGIIYQRKK